MYCLCNGSSAFVIGMHAILCKPLRILLGESMDIDNRIAQFLGSLADDLCDNICIGRTQIMAGQFALRILHEEAGRCGADINGWLLFSLCIIVQQIHKCGFEGFLSKPVFRFAVVAAHHEYDNICVIGKAEGEIISEYRGEGGFGYDPLFYFPPLGKTFGELSAEEKNKISHRSDAIRKMAAELGKMA